MTASAQPVGGIGGAPKLRYDGFLSYSHAADGRLSAAVQSGLHWLARPPFRLRALRIFRDKTSLAANPALWASIEEALSQSRYFLLMASPEAAGSTWVRREVEWWLRHNSSKQLLILLTDGELDWDRARSEFDWSRTTAVPPGLAGAFAEEPLYVDLRWARSGEQLSLRHARFRQAILDVAAPLHGKAKDLLDGEDVRLFKRRRRLAAGAALSLCVATGAAVYGWREAVRQRNEAQRQERAALVGRLSAESRSGLEGSFDRSLLQALAAADLEGTAGARSALLLALQSHPRLLCFLNGLDTEVRATAISEVRSTAIAPGRALLAAGSRDGSSILWDLAHPSAPGSPLPGRRGGVQALAFSPDGHSLASGGRYELVLSRGLDTGRPNEALLDAKGAVNVVAFDRRGGLVATGSVGGAVSVWDVASGLLVWSQKSGGSPMRSLAFSSAGDTLLSGSEDGSVSLWDPRTGRRLSASRVPGVRRATGFAFSPDAATLAVSGEDHSILLWDLARRQPVRDPLRRHLDRVMSLAFSPNGRQLASAGWDPGVFLWNLEGPGPGVERLAGHGGPFLSVSFDPDSRRLSAGAADGKVILWDLRGRPPLGQPLTAGALTAHEAEVGAVAFTPGGRTLVSADLLGTLALWDAASRQRSAQFTGGGADPVSLTALSADGRLLAAVTGSVITLRETATGRARGAPFSEREGKLVTSVALSPDGGRLASGAEDGTLTVHDLGTASFQGIPLDGTPGSRIGSVVFSSDGRWLAAGDSAHEVGVWDTASRRRIGDLLTPLPGKGVRSLAFSPGGGRLAVGGDNGRVVVWDLTSRQPLTEPLGRHEEPISSLSFSPDGQLLVAGDGEGRISLWDAARLQAVGELVGTHHATISGVAFDPGSRLLASGGDDGLVVLWDLDPRSWRERACGIANRNLTCREWRESLGDRAYRAVCPDLPPPADRERCAAPR